MVAVDGRIAPTDVVETIEGTLFTPTSIELSSGNNSEYAGTGSANRCVATTASQRAYDTRAIGEHVVEQWRSKLRSIVQCMRRASQLNTSRIPLCANALHRL
jgi:hypothetical protein